MPVVGRTPYRNLILTGTMGVGKTGAGRLVAAAMADVQFIDAEIELQQREGYTINEIRETFGVARLRSLEKQLVSELGLRRSSVIAVNGVTLSEPSNLERLAETGPILCLTATWGEILRRFHVAYGGRFHDINYRAALLGQLKRERVVLGLGLPTLDTSQLSMETVAEQATAFWREQADL